MAAMRLLSLRYDPEADCALIRLDRAAVAHEVRLDDGRTVLYGRDGRAVAVELIDLIHGGPVDLRGLPCADEIGRLLGAFHVRTTTEQLIRPQP